MKKVLSSILISFVIFANLLAPISVDSANKKIVINKVEAGDIDWTKWDNSISGYQGAFSKSTIYQTSSMYIQSSDSSDITTTIKIDTGISAPDSALLNWMHVKRSATAGGVLTSITRAFSWNLIGSENLGVFKSDSLFILKITETNTSNIGYVDITTRIMEEYLNKTIDRNLAMPYSILKTITINNANGLGPLKSDTDYNVELYYLSDGNEENTTSGGVEIKGLEKNGAYYYKIAEGSAKTADKINQVITTGIVDDAKTVNGNSQSDLDSMPACSMNPLSVSNGTFVGCIAQGFYYVIFVPTSYLFALAGTFFDSAFSYSVQDTSYRSAFVVQGWGLIRDFCNLFFIFILLYVAIGTILDLHGFKTKETIINVIIIGLFINFSLFATQVIIDASNVTARVFYNSDAIKITEKGANDVAGATPGLEIGEDGTIPLSAAIVNKINPQNLIIHSKEIGNIPDKGGSSSSDINGTTNIGAGSFILIVIIASAVNIIGFIVFLSVALMFISRVIGLWIAMILAPLAFFTYILPEQMAGIKMIGWKHWWPETLKLAFMAPVFIFFMYIILKFLELDLFADASSKIASGDGLGFVIAILIPFAFIMILMMKAKGIAKDMSGEIGQQITGAISAVGGMALGGAALGGAVLGRKTIGSFMKGASTGDSSNQRFARGNSINTWDKIKGATAHYGTFGLLTAAQKKVGVKINANQKDVESSSHARHTLDENAQTRYHKKYDELTQVERQAIHDTIDRNILSRETYGNKQYNQLTNAEQAIINTAMATGRAANTIQHGSEHLISEARKKQGIISSLVQSSRNGSFDVRNLSKLVPGEQDKTLNKFATGLTSALASGMRNTMKQADINYGEGQKDFIKDLGHTITESLKSAKIKVDLSHVGGEKKESSHGGGGHH